MHFKIAFIDLDGTLLDPAGAISPRAHEAVRSLEAHGILAVLASGRPPRMVRAFQRELGLEGPAICYNGALVTASAAGGLLWERRLPREVALDVLGLFRKAGATNILCEAGDRLAGELDEKRLARAQREDWGLSADLGLEEAFRDGAHKLMAACPPEAQASLAAQLRAALPARIDLTTSAPGTSWLEVLAAGVNKAAAAAMVAGRLGLDLSAAIAFGDAENDAALLARAGLGVAMANGSPQALAAAGRIAPPNHQEGLARAIEELLAG